MIADLPQYAARAAVYQRRAVEQLRQVAEAAGYQVHAYPLPGSTNDQIPAGAPIEIRLSLPVGSYVYGFTGYSSQAAGFEVQIVDLRVNAALFSAPVRMENVTGQAASPEGVQTPLFLLPAPRIVIEPAVLSVQLKNLATVTNTIEFVVFTLEPEQ